MIQFPECHHYGIQFHPQQFIAPENILHLILSIDAGYIYVNAIFCRKLDQHGETHYQMNYIHVNPESKSSISCIHNFAHTMKTLECMLYVLQYVRSYIYYLLLILLYNDYAYTYQKTLRSEYRDGSFTATKGKEGTREH